MPGLTLAFDVRSWLALGAIVLTAVGILIYLSVRVGGQETT